MKKKLPACESINKMACVVTVWLGFFFFFCTHAEVNGESWGKHEVGTGGQHISQGQTVQTTWNGAANENWSAERQHLYNWVSTKSRQIFYSDLCQTDLADIKLLKVFAQ